MMNDEQLQPRWLTPDEAATYISVSRTTFWRLVKNGDLPAPSKVGERLVRHDRLQLDKYMERENA